ncbi:MAG: hypothetical protein EPO02_13805 [Nitrospirae bacterium]|nr:MAG: hypothetical protein EPO02_13805 [Nitrospirota bacterium]
MAGPQDGGVLSIDQGAALLGGTPEKEETQPTTPADTPETEVQDAEPAADIEASQSEDGTSDDETTETQESDETEATPQLEAIKPPQFWSAEEKEIFNKAPRELQEVFLRNEQLRVTATSKAIQEASEKRKIADAEWQKLTQYTQYLNQTLSDNAKTFADRWENVDWKGVVDQYGAEEAAKLRFTMEEERDKLQRTVAAKKQVEALQFSKFVETETAKLPELAPDLADPKQGLERRRALGSWLLEQGSPHGVTPELLSNLSAFETSIAYDAMRWRNAQAKAKELAKQPKETAAPQQRQTVRPTAAPNRGTHQSARLAFLLRKSSLTTDEGAELLNLRENPR